MNTKALAVMAVVVALLMGWLLISLNSSADSVNLPSATPSGSETSDAGSNYGGGVEKAEVTTSVNVIDTGVTTSVNIAE